MIKGYSEVVYRRRTDSTLTTDRQYIDDGQTVHWPTQKSYIDDGQTVHWPTQKTYIDDGQIVHWPTERDEQ
jgi:hypothetical protein